MPPARPTREVLHIDMDAFYASVEQLDHPELRGQPVIVGADPRNGAGRGVVAACSYEARKFGIHSAMPIRQAWKRCPQGRYVRPRMRRYVEVSRQIMEILRQYTSLAEPLSIDEAFLDVTGSLALYGPAIDIARRIKQEIRERTGLTASVGVAPNKFLAKIASDLRKPDGLVVVRPEEAEAFLRDLPISRLWGVGPKTEKRLHEIGLRTIGQIAATPLADLRRQLGNLGEHLHQLAHGQDDRPVVSDWEPRSVSNEITFDEDTRDVDLLGRTIQSLAGEVGRRLRRSGYRARRITLKLRYEDFTTHTRQTSLAQPTDADNEIAAAALEMFRRFPLDRRIRLIGVGGGNLVRAEHDPQQLDLFGGTDRPADRGVLDRAVDAIRDRFGAGSLRRGSQLLDD